MRKLCATTAFLALASSAVADGTIIEQVFDGESGFNSERNTAVTLATTADDFVIGDKGTITGIWATFLATTDPPLIDWEFDIYTDDNVRPGDLIISSSGGTATDTGGTAFGLAVHTVHFKDISIDLKPGTYWLGIRGVGQNQGTAVWGSANWTNPNGRDVVLKSEVLGFPDWYPWWGLQGEASDAAFTLHGVPAPGALALLGVAGLAARRRRRV